MLVLKGFCDGGQQGTQSCRHAQISQAKTSHRPQSCTEQLAFLVQYGAAQEMLKSSIAKTQ